MPCATRNSRSRILCLVPEVSYETAFSLSFPLVCSLCKSLESLNKPDCCIPLLENLQCLSFAYKIKSRLLVSMKSFIAGSILPSQIHTFHSLEHAVSFSASVLMKLIALVSTLTSPSWIGQFPTHPSTTPQVSSDLSRIVLSSVPLALFWGCYVYYLFLCSDYVRMVLYH